MMYVEKNLSTPRCNKAESLIAEKCLMGRYIDRPLLCATSGSGLPAEAPRELQSGGIYVRGGITEKRGERPVDRMRFGTKSGGECGKIADEMNLRTAAP